MVETRVVCGLVVQHAAVNAARSSAIAASLRSTVASAASLRTACVARFHHLLPRLLPHLLLLLVLH